MLQGRDVIHAKRTPYTALIFTWCKHEMIKDELFAIVKEVAQGNLGSFFGIEFEVGGVGDVKEWERRATRGSDSLELTGCFFFRV